MVDEPRINNSLLHRALHISPDQHLGGLEVLFERPNASFWVGYLLEQGFDVNNTVDQYPTRSGIELASEAGCLQTVRILLKYPGVQVCRADEEDEWRLENEEDALLLAAKGGHLEIFRALLCHVSSTPDLAALVQCSVDRVFRLLAGCGSFQPWGVAFMTSLLKYQDLNRLPFNQLEEAIQSAVSSAFSYGDLDAQEAILDLILHQSSSHFRCRGIHGRTLFQTAVPHALAGSIRIHTFDRAKESVFADKRYTRTLSLLLKHPMFDYSGQYNPLIQFLTERESAVVTVNDDQRGHFAILPNIQMLLKDPRFDPDTSDETGRTALSHASEYHAEYLVRMLLEHPLVNVNSTDVSGRTPLSYAAESDRANHSVLPILLANDNVRENANYPDKAGITPLMYSCRLGGTKEVGLMLDIAGSRSQPT